MPHPALPAIAIIAGFGLALLTSKTRSAAVPGAASPSTEQDPAVDPGATTVVGDASFGQALQEAAQRKP